MRIFSLNFLLFTVTIALLSCKNWGDTKLESTVNKKDTVPQSEEVASSDTQQEIDITPIEHATMVLNYDGTTIYIDPVGGTAAFEGQAAPDLILVTDIHGDHMDPETLQNVITAQTKLIVPQAVFDKLPNELQTAAVVVANGATINEKGIDITAVPMYNLREEALKFHKKGRGNGYVLTMGDKKVYISGDTEDIPEMRNLENIDIAFVCMNLPYTMPVDSAADAVLAFRPKKVYPYHYRGTEGLSDVSKFKTLVNKGDGAIEVVQLDWYPDRK